MESADNGYYKLTWRERIGFCSGELAQNLIYQTISIWLLFYYNNVYGLDSAVVAVMFLVFVSSMWFGIPWWEHWWTSPIPAGANTVHGFSWAAFPLLHSRT